MQQVPSTTAAAVQIVLLTSCCCKPSGCCEVLTLACGLQCDAWELLFHSNKHGQSFNTFMGKVGTASVSSLSVIPHLQAARDVSRMLGCCLLK